MASRPVTPPIIACTVQVITGPNDEVCYCVHLWHAYFADFDVSHRGISILWGAPVKSLMWTLPRTLHTQRIQAQLLPGPLPPPLFACATNETLGTNNEVRSVHGTSALLTLTDHTGKCLSSGNPQ